MKRFCLLLLTGVLTLVVFAPVYAWEFSMAGEFEWRYRYWGRLNGSRDLFGDMSLQNGPGTNLVGFAGPNYYRGFNSGNNDMNSEDNGAAVRVVRQGFSATESDAFLNDQRITFFPKITVNKALEFFAAVDFAGYRHKYNHRDIQSNGPLERWYEDRLSTNAYDTALIPSISQFRLAAHLPWGTLSLGTLKPYPFGTGALFANNTRASAFVLVIPYGPFRIVPAFWVARSFTKDGYAGYDPANATASSHLPTWTTNPDSATKNQYYVGPFITYSNGPLDFGWTIIHQLFHVNAWETQQLAIANRTDSQNNVWTPRGSDFSRLINVFYAKYNNGRFFVNAEYGFSSDEVYYLHAYPGYTERSYAFAEGGVLSGPAKLSLMFGWSGGNALNDNNVTKTTGGWAINYQAMLPYQYLMFYTYGGGNNTPWASSAAPFTAAPGFTVDENGQMGDAYAFAARLDYAVASNLNIWGSYLWAHRVEQNGFYAGGTASTGAAGYTNAVDARNWKVNHGLGTNPYVDDGYIGWEMGFGVDWKLLEGLNLKSRWAYWQPGPWFDQAYQAVTPNNADPTGYLPGKDPINAFEASVEVTF
jgi:hypothetical protein